MGRCSAFCALVAICAGVARATGGPAAVSRTRRLCSAGVQQVGNTSSFTDTCQNGYEFWSLQLKQGDLVKITWGSPAAVDTLALWPPGTVDSEQRRLPLRAPAGPHWTTSPVLSDSIGTPATNRLSQTVVPTDGSYPLLFLDTTGVSERRRLLVHGGGAARSVGLPSAPLDNARGRDADGAPCSRPTATPISDATLKLTLNGYWSTRPGAPPRAHKLATATPTNGSATFSYSLPAGVWGKKIRVAISGGGSSYQAVTSRKQSVKVLVPEGAPVLLSSTELNAASRLLRQPLYWVGPIEGTSLRVHAHDERLPLTFAICRAEFTPETPASTS